MTPRVAALALASLAIAGSAVLAGDFVLDLDGCVRQATHVVVAREGAAIDGVLTVVESWRGDLGAGAEIALPPLADYAPDEARKVTTRSLAEWGEDHPVRVTGERMVLFLRRGEDGRFAQASGFATTSFDPSVVWIERDRAYGFGQVTIPGGPIALLPLGLSERALKERVQGAR